MNCMRCRRRSEAAIASATVEEPGAGRRKANLCAKRKEMVKLPEYSDGSGRVFPVSEFLSHPTGVEALLNTRALQRFEPLDSNTYRLPHDLTCVSWNSSFKH